MTSPENDRTPAEALLERFRSDSEYDAPEPIATTFASVLAAWLGRDPNPGDR